MSLSRLIVAISILAMPAVAAAQIIHPGSSNTILQGGDNISNAFPISFMPFSDVGTTVGYNNDYSGNCGNDYGAPDVVYSYTPPYYEILIISLCQTSNFDTRLYIFDGAPSNIIACNDDYCSNQYSDYVSRLNCIEFLPGHTYYIVVDGYGTASGQYSIDVNYPTPGPEIFGSVRDTGGAAISGADIQVLRDGNPIWNDTSDASGYFYVLGVGEGAYMVEVSKFGYITQTQGPVNVLACDPAFVDFVLEPDTPPCDIIAHPNAIIEDEPVCYDNFVDIYNIGCSAGIWDTIPANCVFFGTSGTYILDGSENRDADWLEFELDDSSNVRLEGMAEFAALMMLIKQGPVNSCDGFEIINYVSSPACTDLIMDSDLGGGKYWVWVGPSEFTGVNCGLNYQFTLTSITLSQCDYVPGDINYSGSFNGIDVFYAVNYFKGFSPPPYSCYCDGHVWYVSGDMNGDWLFNGLDIVYIVNYLKGGLAWFPCPACPPASR